MAETPSSRRPIRAALQRIGRTIREYSPPPEPRPHPTRAELQSGRSAVGVIISARSDEPPEGGYFDDDLVIEIQAEGPDGTVTLLRTVPSPLLGAGAGRKLVGREMLVRHTTLDASFADDVLVEQWPNEIAALKPFRPRGRGASAYRLWSFLWGLGFVIGCSGILLLMASLCSLVGELIFETDTVGGLPAWLQPVVVFAASVVAVPMGFWVYVACGHRADQVRSKIEEEAS